MLQASTSEMEGYRIGAFQALVAQPTEVEVDFVAPRQLAGTEGVEALGPPEGWRRCSAW